MREKVLVTGAAGFIGYHLTRRLIADGCEVVALDDLRCGSWEGFSDQITRVEKDLATVTKSEWAGLLKGIDVVYHLAAEKYNSAAARPESIVTVNVNGTYQLFAAAREAGVRRVVNTSSLYAHGGKHAPSFKESDNPHPWTVYGITKLTTEHLLHHFTLDGGLEGVSLRLFFVFGPRQFAGSGYKSVIMTNFERILRGERPTIRGTGNQTLDYIYVDDVVNALITAAHEPSWNGQLFNIGTGQGRSINEVTAAMLAAADSDLSPITVEADWTDGTQRVGDMTKTFATGAWRPQTSFETGLSAVLDWMNHHD